MATVDAPAKPLAREVPAGGEPPIAPARTRWYASGAFWTFLIVLVLAAAGGLAYAAHARRFEETDDAYVEGAVVSITPQVAARVVAVHVTDNQAVHAGELLVELDPTDYEVALAQMRGAEAAAAGQLEQARAGIASAQSTVDQERAELDAAHTNEENADQDLARLQQLDERAKSRQAEDHAVAAKKSAHAAVEQMASKLEWARTQVASAQANVAIAQGQLDKARADTRAAEVRLGYCRIVAPVDGRIANKNVDPGRYVTSALPMFDVVPPAVWVVANFKETQLARMRPGQAVAIIVDAYPDREWPAHVESFQAGTGARFSVIPAENATGNFVKIVQRVPVKIVFDGDPNADATHLLSLGMSVRPKVRVQD